MTPYSKLLFNSLISGIRKIKSQNPSRKLIVLSDIDPIGVEYRFITVADSQALPDGFSGVIPCDLSASEIAEIENLIN
ncbi:MAG: hypothetical protein IKL83_04960 [Muribaculaceae bacterium]|nr:hypothetical protein [Muribaculaceae bacterium]